MESSSWGAETHERGGQCRNTGVLQHYEVMQLLLNAAAPNTVPPQITPSKDRVHYSNTASWLHTLASRGRRAKSFSGVISVARNKSGML